MDEAKLGRKEREHKNIRELQAIKEKEQLVSTSHLFGNNLRLFQPRFGCSFQLRSLELRVAPAWCALGLGKAKTLPEASVYQ